MTFVAHWKVNEGSLLSPTTAIDSAAGLSGSHNGTYDHYSLSYGKFESGGVGGRNVHIISSGRSSIGSIGNPTDFHISTDLTVMFWFYMDLYGGNYTRKVVNCTGVNNSSADENDWWKIELTGTTLLPTFRMVWQTGVGSNTTVTADYNTFPSNGFYLASIVRYEVTTNKYGVKFYANGSLVNTKDNGGIGWDPPVGGVNALPYVGRDGYGVSQSYFAYDSVRVYDEELNESQIDEIYQEENQYYEGMPVVESGLYSSRSGAGFN